MREIRVFRILILCFSFFIVCSSVKAQSYKDFITARKLKMEQLKKDQDKGIQKLRDNFNKYVEEEDKKFSKYLKNNWRKYKSQGGIESIDEQKIPEAPIFEKNTVISIDLNRLPVLSVDFPFEQPISLQPSYRKRIEAEVDCEFMLLNYFGDNLQFKIDKQVTNLFDDFECTEKFVAEYWNQFTKTNYDILLEYIKEYSTNHSLNNWASFVLLDKIAQKVTNDDLNKRNLFLWSLLNKYGFKAKLAFSDENLILLLPTQNELFGRPYVIIDRFKYYFFNHNGSLGDVTTYPSDFSGANNVFDFNIPYSICLKNDLKTKNIPFNYNDVELNIEFCYNQNLIDFYQTYPLVKPQIVFEAAVSSEFKNSLHVSFDSLLNELEERDAIQCLLSFVQTMFPYKTDDEQFGSEKFFFPEEMLVHPYSDCEDRSIFFSYLVRELLGKNVIGLSYKDHIATAVELNDEIIGDYVLHKGRKYFVADPTFINAPLGMSMPKYKDESVEVICLSGSVSQIQDYDLYWNIANKYNIQSSDNTNLILLADSSAVLSGYIVESDGFMKAVLAKIDADSSLIWLNKFSGKGSSLIIDLLKSSTDGYYMMGSYNDELTCGNFKITGNGKGKYISAIDKNGEIKWLVNSLPYEQISKDISYYLFKYNENGDCVDSVYFNKQPKIAIPNLYEENNLICLWGGINIDRSPLKNNISVNSYSDASDALLYANSKLIEDNYHPVIAGIIAAIDLLKNSDYKISGEAVQEAINRNNEQFKVLYPDFYSNIGKIIFLKGESGVITVQLKEGRKLDFDRLKIYNNAKILPEADESGDVLCKVVSGIKVGKAFIWFRLNSVRLLKKTGEMLFDYDKDHTKVKVNLQKDILN